MTVSTLTTARKAMLRLLELFGEPKGNNPRPCEIRNYLLEVDEFLDTCPALEIERTEATLKQARQVVKESRLLLRIAELQEQLAEQRMPSTNLSKFDTASFVAPRAGTPFPPIGLPPVPISMFSFAMPPEYRMTEKGRMYGLRGEHAGSYEAFIKAGWNNAALLQFGYMERIPDAVCSIGAGAGGTDPRATYGGGGRTVSGGAGSVSSPHVGGGGICDTSWMANAGARGTDV